MRTFIEKYTSAVVAVCMVTLIVTASLFSLRPWVIVLQLAGLALTVWARVTFRGQEFRVVASPGSGALIQRGPYRFIRHPMYAGVMFIMWIGILSHLSILSVVVGVIATIFVVARIHIEEQLLRERYPDYIDYVQSTKRLVPFIY